MKRHAKKCIGLVFSVVPIIFLMAGFAAVSNAGNTKKLSTKLIKIDTRPGITQKLILIKPEKPVASIILFAGDNGRLGLSRSLAGISIERLQKDFLVRNRNKIGERGFMVAVMDAHFNKQSRGIKVSDGLNVLTKEDEIFRMSNSHAHDIKAVAAYLKTKANIPVWLVGTGMGTISAVNAAARLKQEIGGLVLTASVTQSGPEWGPMHKSHPNVINNMNLAKITVPAFVVHHKEDKCVYSPPELAPLIIQGLGSAPKAELMYFSGGEPLSEGCSSSSAHGFYGIDGEVVGAISRFIKTRSK